MPELSIIIVSYNVRQLLKECIQSVINSVTKIDYEIVVVDNASSDRSIDEIKDTFPEVKIVANKENLGFARANNQGYAVSSGDFLLLLNPDTVVKPGAIESVLEFMRNRPDAGLTACRLLNADNSLQKSIRPLPKIGEQLLRALFIDQAFYREYWKKTYYKSEPFEIGYCTGAFMMIRRAALRGPVILSEEFFMYAEEKDLALRLRNNGWKAYFVPFGEVIHYGEKSSGQIPEKMFLELQKSQVKFYKKNYAFFHAWALALTWGLVLFSSLIVSLPPGLSANGRRRVKLFVQAITHYPFMLKAYLR